MSNDMTQDVQLALANNLRDVGGRAMLAGWLQDHTFLAFLGSTPELIELHDVGTAFFLQCAEANQAGAIEMLKEHFLPEGGES